MKTKTQIMNIEIVFLYLSLCRTVDRKVDTLNCPFQVDVFNWCSSPLKFFPMFSDGQSREMSWRCFDKTVKFSRNPLQESIAIFIDFYELRATHIDVACVYLGIEAVSVTPHKSSRSDNMYMYKLLASGQRFKTLAIRRCKIFSRSIVSHGYSVMVEADIQL